MGSGGQFDFCIFGGSLSSTFCYVYIGRYTSMFFRSGTTAEGCSDHYISIALFGWMLPAAVS
jgi:hypothetical protein